MFPVGRFSKVFLFSLCIISGLNARLVRQTRQDLVDLVVEFTLKQLKIGGIIAFVCWDRNESVRLISTSTEFGIFVSVRDVNYTEPSVTWPLSQNIFFLDSACPNSQNFLNLANERDAFRFPSRWLITNTNYISDNVLNFFLNSRVYVVLSENGGFRIECLYRISVNTSYVRQDFGFWKNGKFASYKYLSDSSNRSNLELTLINISSVAQYNVSKGQIYDFRVSAVDASFKYIYPSTMYILDSINATVNSVYHDLYGASPHPETKLFEGVMGHFQQGYSDLGGSPLLTSYSRIEYVDFYYATPTIVKFLYLAPPISSVTNVYAVPFDKFVWISSLFLFIIIVLTFYLIPKTEYEIPYLPKISVPKFERLGAFQIGIGSVCQQGIEYESRCLSGKLASFTTLLSLLFLYTAYSANIIAVLQRTSEAINSLEDLLYSRIVLSAHDTEYNRHYMKMQSYPTNIAIYKTKIAPAGKAPHFVDFKVGMSRVKEEFFGLHAELSRMYKYINDNFKDNEKCRVKVLNYWWLSYLYVPIRKNSTYKELYKTGFSKLLERGVQNRSYRRIYPKKPTCEANGGNFMSISLLDCYFAFVLFGIGLAVVSIIFLCELTLNMYQQNRKKTRNIEEDKLASQRELADIVSID